MKKEGWEYSALLLVTFAVGCLAIGVYASTFGSWPPVLSKNKGDWASFGDYLGGALGPFFGFMGFALLLIQLADARAAQREARLDARLARQDATRQARRAAVVQAALLKRAERSARAAEASAAAQAALVESIQRANADALLKQGELIDGTIRSAVAAEKLAQDQMRRRSGGKSRR